MKKNIIYSITIIILIVMLSGLWFLIINSNKGTSDSNIEYSSTKDLHIDMSIGVMMKQIMFIIN